MNSETAWRLLTSQPVAVLATIHPDGRPHLVPITFASLPGRRLVFAVDEKPKASRSLRRLENIARDPRVTVLTQHYEEDWAGLWWVRADGVASVSDVPTPEARDALVERYPGYRQQALSPWVSIEVTDLTGWTADPGVEHARTDPGVGPGRP